MSNETLKALLIQLHEALESETVTAEKLGELKKLDADIQKLIASEDGAAGAAGLLDRAKKVEAQFEMDHPGTATFFGQLINALSGMGV